MKPQIGKQTVSDSTGDACPTLCAHKGIGTAKPVFPDWQQPGKCEKGLNWDRQILNKPDDLYFIHRPSQVETTFRAESVDYTLSELPARAEGPA